MALAGVGLDPATTLSVIEQSSGQSWIGSDRLRRALQKTNARVPTGLACKDSALALAAASAAQTGCRSPKPRRATSGRPSKPALALADDSALLALDRNRALAFALRSESAR